MGKGFIFRDIYYKAISQMDEYNQIKFYDAICNYALKNEFPNFEGKDLIIFKLLKNLIDDDMAIPADDIIIEE